MERDSNRDMPLRSMTDDSPLQLPSPSSSQSRIDCAPRIKAEIPVFWIGGLRRPGLGILQEHGASFIDADMHKTPGSLVPASILVLTNSQFMS